MDPETDLQTAPPAEPGSTQTFDWESDENPYKTRFNDYRSEADRRATRLSQYEQNLEDLRSDDLARQRAAATALGIDLVEEPEPEYADPYDSLRAELTAVKGQLTAAEQRELQRDQERAQERAAVAIEDRLSKLDLDESDKDLVLARAIALPVGDDGLPNISAAYDELRKRDEAAMQRWQQTKKAPRSIAPGSAATATKNIMEMSDEERVDWAVQRLESM